MQINYYFDSPDGYLLRSGGTLRVRLKDGRLALHYKASKRPEIDSYSSRQEFQKGNISQVIPLTISEETYKGLFDVMDLPESEQGYPKFYLLGSLTTIRYLLENEGIRFSVDVNYYLNHVDYEFESEGVDKTLQSVSTFLSKFILVKSSTKGKFERFSKALHRLID